MALPIKVVTRREMEKQPPNNAGFLATSGLTRF